MKSQAWPKKSDFSIAFSLKNATPVYYAKVDRDTFFVRDYATFKSIVLTRKDFEASYAPAGLAPEKLRKKAFEMPTYREYLQLRGVGSE